MKYCVKCKLNLELDMFVKNKARSDGLSSCCKLCQNKMSKEHYYNNKQYYLDKEKVRKNKMKDWFTSLKSKLECKICKESEISCLDFHHLDPLSKEGSIGVMLNRNAKSKIIAEIAKCIVLCSNCHRKHHAGKLPL
jgi:hypothetical protein